MLSLLEFVQIEYLCEVNNANLNKQSFNKTSAHHDVEINHIGLTQPHKGAYKINSIQAIKEKR